ncbi:MAG: hypothetical protein IPP34_18075 [Bacteroidetes bacterium]|nr:hypothetical protein [Bacteroidota bacterium]
MFLLRSQRFPIKEKGSYNTCVTSGKETFPSHLPRVEVAIEPLESVTDSKRSIKKLLSNWNMNLEDYL